MSVKRRLSWLGADEGSECMEEASPMLKRLRISDQQQAGQAHYAQQQQQPENYPEQKCGPSTSSYGLPLVQGQQHAMAPPPPPPQQQQQFFSQHQQQQTTHEALCSQQHISIGTGPTNDCCQEWAGAPYQGMNSVLRQLHFERLRRLAGGGPLQQQEHTIVRHL